MSARTKQHIIVMIVLFGLSLVLRLGWTVPTGFNGFYGQDAYAYSDTAQRLASGQSPGDLFWPVGYPLILSAGYRLIGVSVGQAVSVLSGALLVPLMYALACQLGLYQVSAFFAALLMAFCGQAIQSSLVVMADIPALLLTTLSAMALLRYFRDEKASILALSAVLLAFASITRWICLLLAPAWALSLLLHWRRVRWKASILALTLALSILIPQMLINRNTSLAHEWVTHWSLSNAFQHSFVNVDGTFTYALPNLEFYAAPLLNAYYLSPIFVPLFIIGLWRAAHHLKRRAFLLLIGWLIVPVLYLAGIPYQNIRFPLIVFPAVLIFIGCGIIQLQSWPGIRTIFPVILLMGIAHTSAVSQGIISDFVDHQQQDRKVVEIVDTLLPDNATLYTFELTLTFAHYTSLDVHEIYYETPQSLRAKWKMGQRDYLLINVWVVEHQWDGLVPQTVYHWFRDVRGLKQIGRWGNYTLFRTNG